MYISRLALDHFRSWDHVVVDFQPGVNILQGANGIGKTNLVEAIEVLSTGSSHRVSSSLPLVERGELLATIRANVASEQSDGADQVDTYELSVRAKGTNRARINGGASLYMRDLVGKVPSVSFTPEDQRLVTGEPGQRRSFMNQAASMLVPGYAQDLQDLTHIGKQRAAILKQLGSADPQDQAGMQAMLGNLEIWTGQFTQVGIRITRARQQVVERLAKPAQAIYSELAGAGEELRLQYEPSFEEIFFAESPEEAIGQHFQRIYAGERARGQNLIGPQRDDLSVFLNDMPAREFASNGEMWTIALTLKMALHKVLEEAFGEQPVVILDDVFAQLDESRRAQILAFAGKQRQSIITVAAATDLPQLRGERVVDVAALREAQDGEEAIKETLKEAMLP